MTSLPPPASDPTPLRQEGFSIRPTVADDVDEILVIFEAVAAERIWIGTQPGFDRVERAARMRDQYADPSTFSGFVVVRDEAAATSGDAVPGRIVGSVGLATPASGVAGLGMMLLDGYRGRGLGSALLAAAVERARDAGMHKIALERWPHNIAGRALYERFGFVEEGRLRRQYRRSNGELWDSIVMGLVLDDDAPGCSIPE